MKSAAILLVFVGLSFQLEAQSFVFKVLGSSGLNEVKSKNVWGPIKTGQVLQQNDEVKVAANGYLGLYHASGKPLQVKEPGTYKVVELVAKLGPSSTALSKYTDFILSTEQEKKNKLAATGAVHRGVISRLTLFLPGSERADLFSDHFSLNWSSDGSEKYFVSIKNLSDDLLGRYEVNGTSFSVDLKKIRPDDPVILVSVSSRSGASTERFTIKMLSPSQKAKTRGEIDELGLVSRENDALEKYVLANFFEEKSLFIDALTAYKEAADLEPNVEMFRDAYKQFLDRLGYSVK